MSRINAFILAAGFGERLRPITNHIPKPLLPILGKPLVGIVVDHIATLSPKKIGINMHHQWEQIRKWAETSPLSGRLQLFHENEILGTGGALFNAGSLFKESACIVHNADILTDIDLWELIEKHFKSNKIATLAVHDYVKFNNVWIDRSGNLKHVGRNIGENSGLCDVAFMGIAVYSPEFLSFLPEGRSSVVDAWLKAINRGHTIGTVDFSGAAWTDIGTPDAYAAAVFDALKKAGETVYIHESVDCSSIWLGSNAVIENGAFIEGQPCISNSVILPGARIFKNIPFIDHVIAGPGFSVEVDRATALEAIDLPPSLLSRLGCRANPVDAVCIGTGGSDRTYFRINGRDGTAVLMKCSETDPDYRRHIALTVFFRKCGLPVPELFGHDEQSNLAIFEDLGDLSFYSWLTCRRSPERREALYRKILDILVTLHTAATVRLSECSLLLKRVFDYDHLRWETSYFLERFVLGIKGISVSGTSELETDFDSLARTVDAYHKTIVHRDFQSQNIMIMKGDMPRLIDYQGSRIGPPAYDIASLLWDPYVRMVSSMQGKLLDYYISRMKGLRHDFDEAEFRQSLLPCRLQRHMQALGAYGFLSMVKGKHYFLKHVPLALEYLNEEAALGKEDFPAIHDLVTGLI